MNIFSSFINLFLPKPLAKADPMPHADDEYNGSRHLSGAPYPEQSDPLPLPPAVPQSPEDEAAMKAEIAERKRANLEEYVRENPDMDPDYVARLRKAQAEE